MAVESGHDISLDALLTTESAEFDRRLEILLASVTGLVQQAVRRTLQLHFAAQPGSIRDNVDDLASEAIVVLVRKVRDLHRDPSSEPIQNFEAYAATVASNVCYAYLRRQYPARTRLKNQVRYIATRDPDLALREMGAGLWFCLLAKWDTDGLVQMPRLLTAEAIGPDVDPHALPLRDLVKQIVRNAGCPVEVNNLVRMIAELRGIHDPLPTPGDDLLERVADTRPARSPDDVSFLRQVWVELKQLPLRQRIALLLNLRDQAGRSVLALFPLTAIASIVQIAEVLEMPSQELARMWNDLPIDDRRIAERLCITRQQVINLRKAARARLARRVAGWRS